MLEKFLKCKLQDGTGETGGISFIGETLEDFLKETEMTNATIEDVNKELVNCGILPVVDFVWDMKQEQYNLDTEEFQTNVDECIGQIRIGDICADIIIRNYGDNSTDKYAYSFDLYVFGEDNGYGYKENKEGRKIPYDYADGGDVYLEDMPTEFKEFKERMQKEIMYYIAKNDMKYGSRKKYSLVEKASKPVRYW